jgi:hypothetical protein
MPALVFSAPKLAPNLLDHGGIQDVENPVRSNLAEFFIIL